MKLGEARKNRETIRDTEHYRDHVINVAGKQESPTTLCGRLVTLEWRGQVMFARVGPSWTFVTLPLFDCPPPHPLTPLLSHLLLSSPTYSHPPPISSHLTGGARRLSRAICARGRHCQGEDSGARYRKWFFLPKMKHNAYLRTQSWHFFKSCITPLSQHTFLWPLQVRLVWRKRGWRKAGWG